MPTFIVPTFIHVLTKLLFASPTGTAGLRQGAPVLGMLSLLVFTLAGPASADEGWVPFECAEPLRNDRSGGQPVPSGAFPETDVEVVRAFETGVRELLFGSWWRATFEDLEMMAAEALGLEEYVPAPSWSDPNHAALLEAIRERVIEYRVERVVSWEPRRCTGRADRQIAFYLDGSWDGGELSALLWRSGELRRWGIRTPGDDGDPIAGALPSLDEATAILAAEVGGPLEDVQYVLATGYPHCHAVPCVAARRGETLYLLEPGRRLFAFALTPRPEHEVVPPPGERCIGAPCPGDPWAVAVGDRWLAGEVVGLPELPDPPAGQPPA